MTAPLWVITTYFNPVQYRRRLRNYRVFRERLGAPLLAVELSFGKEFELSDGDADRVVRVRGRDVMFQKERLLNIALGALPAECEVLAWIDCDTILGASDWVGRTVEALDRYRLVHLFEEQCNLPRDADPEEIGRCGECTCWRSVVSRLARGEMTMADLRADAEPVPETSWGLAYAARRELLDVHGYYDSCISGSGDVAMVCAALGGLERPKSALRMGERQYRHYLDWARPFHDAVRGEVGCVEGRIYHLWHGEFKQRKYIQRHRHMEPFDLDPAKDLRIGEQGCWEWGSDKPEMHAHVTEYFRSRMEDG